MEVHCTRYLPWIVKFIVYAANTILTIQNWSAGSAKNVIDLSDGHISGNFIRNFDFTYIDFDGTISVGLDAFD